VNALALVAAIVVSTLQQQVQSRTVQSERKPRSALFVVFAVATII